MQFRQLSNDNSIRADPEDLEKCRQEMAQGQLDPSRSQTSSKEQEKAKRASSS
ncbi:hypothetical protein KIN20_002415 [Parelaphostrongylus tenuis]|uniref:Uncharacterized protein n=1 Tax=Parelaphostrongylus tenuis TaxID=148309 RepID=A0AAD5QFA9_PARTN|nr:hypothetical protein KIN20_002415 [Parelaphostrongylus tenuis]